MFSIIVWIYRVHVQRGSKNDRFTFSNLSLTNVHRFNALKMLLIIMIVTHTDSEGIAPKGH